MSTPFVLNQRDKPLLTRVLRSHIEPRSCRKIKSIRGNWRDFLAVGRMLPADAPQQAGQQNADNLLATFVSGHGLGINGIGHSMAPGEKQSPSICYLCRFSAQKSLF